MEHVIKSYGAPVGIDPMDSVKADYCPKCGAGLITVPVNASPGDQIPDKSVNSLTKCSNHAEKDKFCDYEIENRGLKRYGQPNAD